MVKIIEERRDLASQMLTQDEEIFRKIQDEITKSRLNKKELEVQVTEDRIKKNF
jgi:hypothetical protein